MRKLFIFILLSFILTAVGAQELKTYLPIKKDVPQGQNIVKLLTKIGELSGIKFTIDDTLPMVRATVDIEAGTIDAYAGMLATKTGSWVNVPEPLLTGNNYIVTAKPFDYKGEADLSGKKVIAGRESAAALKVQQNKNIIFVEAPDNIASIKMLLGGRGDFLIMHQEAITNVFQTNPEFKDQVYIDKDPSYLQVNNMIALSKKYANLAPKIDKALKDLKASGEYAKILSGK